MAWALPTVLRIGNQAMEATENHQSQSLRSPDPQSSTLFSKMVYSHGAHVPSAVLQRRNWSAYFVHIPKVLSDTPTFPHAPLVFSLIEGFFQSETLSRPDFFFGFIPPRGVFREASCHTLIDKCNLACVRRSGGRGRCITPSRSAASGGFTPKWKNEASAKARLCSVTAVGNARQHVNLDV